MSRKRLHSVLITALFAFLFSFVQLTFTTNKADAICGPLPDAVIDIPFSSSVDITVGGAVWFNGIGSGGTAPYTYLWDFDGGATNSTLREPGFVTFSTLGTYNVTFTAWDSCPVSSIADTITINTTGININDSNSCIRQTACCYNTCYSIFCRRFYGKTFLSSSPQRYCI